MIEIHKNRAIITLAGPERKNLLQSIITANINHLGNDRGLYAALLTPQGKFLHDFFLYEDNEIIYLDCERDRIADLFRRLLMYRLRSKVEIIDCSRNFSVITSSKKINGYDLNFTDPRHSEMGCRAIVEIDTKGAKEDTYHTRRIALGIPEGSHDFIVEKSTILEGHFEQINGVDFEKGCYVGQEVTARMKYRGTIKKLIFPVTLSGSAPPFDSIITNELGQKIGNLRSHHKSSALAIFRLEKMEFGQSYDCCNIKLKPYMPDFYAENTNV